MGIKERCRELPCSKVSVWLPLVDRQVKQNRNGSVQSNLIRAGGGISFRDSRGQFLALVTVGLGQENIFWAEIVAILVPMEIAVEKGWRDIWIDLDSLEVVQNMNENKVPWKLKFRWDMSNIKRQKVIIMHILCDANQATNQAENLATDLDPNEVILFEGKP